MKKRILAMLLIAIMTIGIMVFPGIGSIKAGASQTFEKVDFINGVVIADKLNLRSGPSTQHEVIGKFSKHKWLNVLAKMGTGMQCLILKPVRLAVYPQHISKVLQRLIRIRLVKQMFQHLPSHPPLLLHRLQPHRLLQQTNRKGSFPRMKRNFSI